MWPFVVHCLEQKNDSGTTTTTDDKEKTKVNLPPKRLPNALHAPRMLSNDDIPVPHPPPAPKTMQPSSNLTTASKIPQSLLTPSTPVKSSTVDDNVSTTSNKEHNHHHHHHHHHHDHGQSHYHGMIVALAGGASAAITRVFVQPLDVLKIRFQLQVEPLNGSTPTTNSTTTTSTAPSTTTTTTTTKLPRLSMMAKSSSSKYRSMRQACEIIWREEGIRAFWKGHTAAQLLSISYGITQFVVYDYLKLYAKRNHHLDDHPLTMNFICGGIAGGVGTILTTPLDVVRTRLISQDRQRGYANLRSGMKQIVRLEGISGLYRGAVPGVVQVAPLMGVNFMFYDLFSKTARDLLHLESKTEIPAAISLFNGGLSGLISKIMLYPLDLIKKRLQIQGFQDHRKSYGAHFTCTGLISCMMTTIKHEGYFGLYKGMAPSLWKAALTSGLHFGIYNNIVNLCTRLTEK